MVDPASISHTLNAFGKIHDFFVSFSPLLYRFKAHNNLKIFVENYFGSDLQQGAIIKTSGVLSPYSCCSSDVLYTPIIPKDVSENVVPQIFGSQVQLQWTYASLSMPVASLSDVELEDKNKARIAWLYPLECTGLIFDHILTEENKYTGNLEVKHFQMPVPVLLPANGKFDNYYGKKVEVIASVFAANPETISPLLNSLDQFRIQFLSNCIRPFEDKSNCFALDLRQNGCDISLIEDCTSFNAVVGVQGIIDTNDLTTDEKTELFISTLDSIPDRSGMGPLRAHKHEENTDIQSVLSIGNIRWFFNARNNTISAFQLMDFSSREDTHRKTTELANHWQAWQKKARKELSKRTNIDVKIRPISIWNPNKINLFNPDGLQLPPKLEKAVLSEDPMIRKTIDWLNVGNGQF